MQVLAFCAVASVASDVVDEDHMSVLQQSSARQGILERAHHSSDVATKLEGAVAGKKGKCNELEAAEMVSCIRVGEHTLLDVLAGRENWAEFERATTGSLVPNITTKNAQCLNLKTNLKCMVENPCYKLKKVELLPLDWQLDGETMRTKQVCKNFRNVDLYGGDYSNQRNRGQRLMDICNEDFQKLCERAWYAFPGLRDEWEYCGFSKDTCASEKIEFQAELDPMNQLHQFVVQERFNAKCTDTFQTLKTMKDCERAAKNLRYKEDGEPHEVPFQAIRYQKRPAGCYLYKKKVWWNKVKQGSGPLSKRMPICWNV